MESYSSIKCVDCSGLCCQSQMTKGSDTFHEQHTCQQCNFENFAIKCVYCSSFVVSLLREELAPGVIIKCQNLACKKDFQYITCPNPCCRKLSYRQSIMPMGVVTQCDYCHTQFQDAICDLCYTENYFKGDSHGVCYFSGIKTSCRGCQGSFLQFSCPDCKKTIYQNAKTYAPGMKIQCDTCSSSFQQTNCAVCISPNYYFNNDLKIGMLEKCACGVTYKTYICKDCGDIEPIVTSLPILGINSLTIEDERKIVEVRCKKCNVIYEQVPCSSCGQACYTKTSDLERGPTIIKCNKCNILTAHVFKCTACPGTYFSIGSRTTCYKSHPAGDLGGPSRLRSQSPSGANARGPVRQSPFSILLTSPESPSRSWLFNDLPVPSTSETRTLFSNSRAQTNSNANQSKDIKQKLDAIKDSDDTPTENEEKRCCVCLSNEKKVVFIPCGHFSCCLSCTKAIMQSDKKCPICKIKIDNFQRIYTT